MVRIRRKFEINIFGKEEIIFSLKSADIKRKLAKILRASMDDSTLIVNIEEEYLNPIEQLEGSG
jgi:hypothetical protein